MLNTARKLDPTEPAPGMRLRGFPRGAGRPPDGDEPNLTVRISIEVRAPGRHAQVDARFPSDMNAARSLASLLLILLGGCGGPDPTPDAGSPKGNWRLVGQTVAGSQTPEASLDGSLDVGDSEYAFGTMSPPGGIVTTYSLSGASTIKLGDGTVVPFTLAPGQLTLQLAGNRTVTFAPASTDVHADAYPVQGTVTLADGTPSFTAPRVALVFLCRGGMFAECHASGTDTGFSNDPRDDQALTFNGKTATFDLSRERGALGTQRITFGGQTAGISVGYVVVYDGDAPGTLQQLFAPCGSSMRGCPRGVAPFALAYRDGVTAALTASPYAHLHNGWTDAFQVTDQRGGQTRTGLVSGDSTKMPPFDVAVPADPSQVTIVKLDLKEP